MDGRCPIYIVDSDTGMRRHLVELLRTADYYPTPFANGRDFLDARAYLKAGIALIELHLSDMNGMAVLDELLSSRRDIPAILTAVSPNIRTAVEAIKRGADDFIEKPFADNFLVQMIDNTVSLLETRIDTEFRKKHISSFLNILSERETEIISALKENSDNQYVANKLHLSVRTIESYRGKIMRKFGVSRFSDAILLLAESEKAELPHRAKQKP